MLIASFIFAALLLIAGAYVLGRYHERKLWAGWYKPWPDYLRHPNPFIPGRD